MLQPQRVDKIVANASKSLRSVYLPRMLRVLSVCVVCECSECANCFVMTHLEFTGLNFGQVKSINFFLSWYLTSQQLKIFWNAESWVSQLSNCWEGVWWHIRDSRLPSTKQDNCQQATLVPHLIPMLRIIVSLIVPAHLSRFTPLKSFSISTEGQNNLKLRVIFCALKWLNECGFGSPWAAKAWPACTIRTICAQRAHLNA